MSIDIHGYSSTRRQDGRKLSEIQRKSCNLYGIHQTYLTVHKWSMGDVLFYLKSRAKMPNPFKNGAFSRYSLVELQL